MASTSPACAMTVCKFGAQLRPLRALPATRRSIRVAATFDLPPPTGARASAVPGPEEDREVAHEAFMHAFQEAQPERARVPGLQEFASAILSRSRIPSQQYSDPLKHIFQEFDTNGDGSLEAHEVGEALRSRNVNVSDEQVVMFIDAVDLSHSHKVHQSEFRDFILHMAAADLHSRQAMHDEEEDGEWVKCTLESDDEIQVRLKSWVDNLMLRRYR